MTLALSWPVLGFERVYEDRNAETLAVPWQGLRAEMGTWTRKPQRMLTTLSFQATGALGGSTVLDHAVNLAGIALTVAVVISAVPSASGVILAGALIGWHPLQTESIAYLSARADVLLGLFTALGLVAVERKSWIGAAVAVIGAFASKESGVMLAPLLLLWADWRGAWSLKASVVIGVLFGLLGAFLWLRYPIQPSLAPAGQVGYLLSRLIWPSPLTVDYDWTGFTAQTGALTLMWGVALAAVACTLQKYTYALCLVGLAVWFLPRVLVPLHEGLHAHHLTGVLPWIAITLTARREADIYG